MAHEHYLCLTSTGTLAEVDAMITPLREEIGFDYYKLWFTDSVTGEPIPSWIDWGRLDGIVTPEGRLIRTKGKLVVAAAVVSLAYSEMDSVPVVVNVHV